MYPVFPPETPLFPVKIAGVAPALMIATDDRLRLIAERFQAIIREHEEAGPARGLQERVLTMMQRLESTYTYVIARLGAREAAEEAVVYGRPSTTVELELPPEAATAGDRFLDLLDQADEYCRSVPSLADVVSTPEVVAFRRWFIGEISRQLRDVR